MDNSTKVCLSLNWIPSGLQKSVSVKNITYKALTLKEEFHVSYKNDRNLLSTLMKNSKQAYYDKYFEISCNNIKNTWNETISLFL